MYIEEEFMSELFCPIHKKPLKAGKYGLYCNKPLVKSADGETVLEWCHYKPGEAVTQPSQASAIPQKQPEEVREPVSEGKPDWEGIARGKVRNSLVTALIEHRGLEHITGADVDLLEGWVSYIMSGPTSNSIPEEDIDF